MPHPIISWANESAKAIDHWYLLSSHQSFQSLFHFRSSFHVSQMGIIKQFILISELV
jgi:hypothetical protein